MIIIGVHYTLTQIPSSSGKTRAGTPVPVLSLIRSGRQETPVQARLLRICTRFCHDRGEGRVKNEVEKRVNDSQTCGTSVGRTIALRLLQKNVYDRLFL